MHSQAPVKLQAKLKINTPGDIYEQEADRVAEEVTSMPEPQVQRGCACGGGCPGCQNDQADQHVQTKPIQTKGSEEIAAPPIVNEVLRSSGQPLDENTQRFMESRFGHDFSQVRVHTDARAAKSARAVNALAYTVGRDVIFGSERYRPSGTEGRNLLAHELTHVLQQGTGDRLQEVMFNASSTSEQAAAQVDEGALDGGSATHTLPNWIARRVTPRARHVMARKSSGEEEETSTAMSETADTQAGHEAMLPLALKATLKEFLSKKSEQSKLNTKVAKECKDDARMPYIVGPGIEGLARNGVEMVFGIESDSKNPEITKEAKFEFDQKVLETYAWERVPNPNGGEQWKLLGSDSFDDNSPHQKCVTPNDNKEIFKWDQVGFSTVEVTGLYLLSANVSSKATGVVLRTNFMTKVLANKGNGPWKAISSVEWHSINSAAPVGPLKDNNWMVDNSGLNEIEQGKTDVSKP